MSLDTTLDELARTAGNGAAARALPAGCYRDPAFFELEVERVLRPAWHAVARFDELPEPGDFRSLDLFGERVVLVRDESRRLRAFSGICLHRGFPFADGEGNAKRFTCPYHLWSYGLDGRLRSAPLMDAVPGFDREAQCLPEFSLEEWMGFVFVSTQADPAPFSESLAALENLLSPVNLEDAVDVAVVEWDSPWNWKIMVENFIESYHHIGIHADNLAHTNPAKGTHALDIEGPCVVLENPAAGDAPPFWVVQIFPTFLLAQVRGDVPTASWYEMQIDRHDHFTLRVHLLLPKEHAEDKELVEATRNLFNLIHLEDIPACEGIQAGMQSRVWSPGMLSVQETTLHRFHRLLADAVKG